MATRQRQGEHLSFPRHTTPNPHGNRTVTRFHLGRRWMLVTCQSPRRGSQRQGRHQQVHLQLHLSVLLAFILQFVLIFSSSPRNYKVWNTEAAGQTGIEAKMKACNELGQTWMESGCELISEAWETFHDVKISHRNLIWNSAFIETIELENLLINKRNNNAFGRGSQREQRSSCS